MITTKLSEDDLFVVERDALGTGDWVEFTHRTSDYETARAWAGGHPDRRVVLMRATRFVCVDA